MNHSKQESAVKGLRLTSHAWSERERERGRERQMERKGRGACPPLERLTAWTHVAGEYDDDDRTGRLESSADQVSASLDITDQTDRESVFELQDAKGIGMRFPSLDWQHTFK